MKISSIKIGAVILFISVFSNMLSQDMIEVSGIILGMNGKPLPGVSVGIDESQLTPEVTDENGKFELEVDDGNAWLIINPIGNYQPKQVFLNNRTELIIYLTEKDIASGHKDIVYTGEQKKKRDILAAVDEVNPEDFLYSSNQTLDQSFQGKVPGVYFSNHSGLPGTGGFMFLRGVSSMNTNSQPLYIVDGVPLEFGGEMQSLAEGYAYNPLTTIEPFDITNISILKDAAATSLYGMKGSNGVVIIETLKPTETRTTIDFSVRTGINRFAERLPQLNSSQYKTLANEILMSTGTYEEEFKEVYPGLYYSKNDENIFGEQKYSHNNNWQNEVFNNSFNRDVYMSVKGGDAIARYGLSVGYLQHDGNFNDTYYNRFTTRFVGTFNIFQWLRMYINANLTSTNSKFNESALQKETSPLLTSLFKTPQLTAYQWDTSMVKREIEPGVFTYDTLYQQTVIIDTVDEQGISNPKAVVENTSTSNSNYRFLTSFRLEGDITDNLRLNSLLGLNINSYREKLFWPNLGMARYYDDQAYNVSKEMNNLLFAMYNDNYLSYRKRFNKIHEITGLAGMKWQTNELEQDWGIDMNSPENDAYQNLGSGTGYLRRMGGESANWNWISTYARLGYSLKDKYMVNISATGDMSSRVGSNADLMKIDNVPVAFFYSVGGGWRLSNEDFLKNASALEELKIRASYGISGNDDIGEKYAFSYYQITHYRITTGLIPGGLANTSLMHENVAQYNIGLDLSLWGNRLYTKLDLFRTDTRNMLVFEKQNPHIGYESYASNNAGLSNQGWEFELFSRIINSANFSFDLSFNIAGYTNKVTKMPGGEIIKQYDHAEIISREGEAVNSFYGYIYEGVFSTAEEANNAGPDNSGLVNNRNIPFEAGDAKFADLSGPDGAPDGKIDDYDKVLLGSPNPDFFGGLTTSLRYKRWGLNLFWQFVQGNDVFNYLRYQNEKMSDLANQSIVAMKRWTFEGQDTDIPRAFWNDPVGNSAFSSRWIETNGGSYLRLREVTLSYQIDKQFSVFRDLNLFLTGRNLLTFSQYLGYDPEFSYSFDPLRQGIDYGLMPQSTQVMLGVKFGL